MEFGMEELDDKKKKNRVIGQEVRKIKQEKTGKNFEEEDLPFDEPVRDSEDNLAKVSLQKTSKSNTPSQNLETPSEHLIDESLYESTDNTFESLFLSKSVFASKEELLGKEITAVPQENDTVVKTAQNLVFGEEIAIPVPTKQIQELQQTPVELNQNSAHKIPTQEYGEDEFNQLKEVEEEIKELSTKQLGKKEKPPIIVVPAAKTGGTKESSKPGMSAPTKEIAPKQPVASISATKENVNPNTNGVENGTPKDSKTEIIPNPKPASAPITKRWIENAQIRHDKSIIVNPTIEPEASNDAGFMQTEQMPINGGKKISVWMGILIGLIILLGTTIVVFLLQAPNVILQEITVQYTTTVEEEYLPKFTFAGQVTWEKTQDILAPIPGPIVELRISLGMTVRVGDIVAEIFYSAKDPKVPVKATLDGEITQIFVEKNTRVTTNYRIATISSLRKAFGANVRNIYYSKFANQLGKNLEAKCIWGNGELSGKMTEIQWHENHTWIKFSLSKDEVFPNTLNIGSPVWIKVGFPEKVKGIFIPKTSIVQTIDKQLEFGSAANVFVLEQDNRKNGTAVVRAIPVLLGMVIDDNVEIIEGIEEGINIVTSASIGISNLCDGNKVSIKK